MAPPVPRQECEQVRNQLLYCWRRPLLPLASARRITANGPLGPCSFASVRAMMIRTLAPRLCAARSAPTNTQLLKFQVIARILPRLGVCRMARRTLELISCERGTLNETPCRTRNRAGALASRSTPRSLSVATRATEIRSADGAASAVVQAPRPARTAAMLTTAMVTCLVVTLVLPVSLLRRGHRGLGRLAIVGSVCRVGQAWQALSACLNCSLSIRLGTSLICLPVTA